MKFSKYQREVEGIVEYNATEAAFWVTEEAGEIAKAFKTPPPGKDYVFDEIGDVLIALTNLCIKMGISIDDVAEASLKKWEKKLKEKSLRKVAGQSQSPAPVVNEFSK